MCNDLIQELKEEDRPQLLNIGACGLHVVHGAFKSGIKTTGWNIGEFFRCAYYVLN